MKAIINHFTVKRVKFYVIQFVLIFAFNADLNAQSLSFLSLIDASNTASSTALNTVCEKTIKKFYRKFKEADNVKWFIQDKNYLVKFSRSDLKHQALYNKRGSLIYTIVYGVEKHVPYFIKSKIKLNYMDYAIKSAINVKEANRNIWIINIENHKNRVTLRVEDNMLEEVLYTKAS